MDDARPLEPLVRKLMTLMDLGAEDQAAITALPHEVRRIEHGRYIAREGDVPTHCCLLVSGFAMRHKIVGDGARQIVNIHMAGDMVDLQNALLGVADHNVQALTTMTAAFMRRDALVEGSIQREWVVNVGRRDARTRVAHILCEFAYRLDAVGLGKKCNYELPMTQEQLADAVGLTAVHVNRTLKGLDAEGLTTRSKKSVVINDLHQLAEVGDFRSTYLHLPQHVLPAYLQ